MCQALRSILDRVGAFPIGFSGPERTLPNWDGALLRSRTILGLMWQCFLKPRDQIFILADRVNLRQHCERDEAYLAQDITHY